MLYFHLLITHFIQQLTYYFWHFLLLKLQNVCLIACLIIILTNSSIKEKIYNFCCIWWTVQFGQINLLIVSIKQDKNLEKWLYYTTHKYYYYYTILYYTTPKNIIITYTILSCPVMYIATSLYIL